MALCGAFLAVFWQFFGILWHIFGALWQFLALFRPVVAHGCQFHVAFAPGSGFST
jgi:hypothetical protein